MAINRYFTPASLNGPQQPFQLPYDRMADALLSRQQAFDQGIAYRDALEDKLLTVPAYGTKDTEFRNKRIEDYMSQIDEIANSYNGDYGAAQYAINKIARKAAKDVAIGDLGAVAKTATGVSSLQETYNKGKRNPGQDLRLSRYLGDISTQGTIADDGTYRTFNSPYFYEDLDVDKYLRDNLGSVRSYTVERDLGNGRTEKITEYDANELADMFDATISQGDVAYQLQDEYLALYGGVDGAPTYADFLNQKRNAFIAAHHTRDQTLEGSPLSGSRTKGNTRAEEILNGDVYVPNYEFMLGAKEEAPYEPFAELNERKTPMQMLGNKEQERVIRAGAAAARLAENEVKDAILGAMGSSRINLGLPPSEWEQFIPIAEAYLEGTTEDLEAAIGHLPGFGSIDIKSFFGTAEGDRILTALSQQKELEQDLKRSELEASAEVFDAFPETKPFTTGTQATLASGESGEIFDFNAFRLAYNLGKVDINEAQFERIKSRYYSQLNDAYARQTDANITNGIALSILPEEAGAIMDQYRYDEISRYQDVVQFPENFGRSGKIKKDGTLRTRDNAWWKLASVRNYTSIYPATVFTEGADVYHQVYPARMFTSASEADKFAAKLGTQPKQLSTGQYVVYDSRTPGYIKLNDINSADYFQQRYGEQGLDLYRNLQRLEHQVNMNAGHANIKIDDDRFLTVRSFNDAQGNKRWTSQLSDADGNKIDGTKVNTSTSLMDAAASLMINENAVAMQRAQANIIPVDNFSFKTPEVKDQWVNLKPQYQLAYGDLLMQAPKLMITDVDTAGIHKDNSWHYRGAAIDIRLNGGPSGNEAGQAAQNLLKEVLPSVSNKVLTGTQDFVYTAESPEINENSVLGQFIKKYGLELHVHGTGGNRHIHFEPNTP